MSTKLLWTGLTLILALPAFMDFLGKGSSPAVPILGAIVMVIGLVLLWLENRA